VNRPKRGVGRTGGTYVRGAAGSLFVMAVTPSLDPELTAVVEHARRRARDAGELRPPRPGPHASRLSPEAREIVLAWLHDGGYDEAVASVVADDPELATQ
jgi:hypothetical protein